MYETRGGRAGGCLEKRRAWGNEVVERREAGRKNGGIFKEWTGGGWVGGRVDGWVGWNEMWAEAEQDADVNQTATTTRDGALLRKMGEKLRRVEGWRDGSQAGRQAGSRQAGQRWRRR